MTVITTLAGRHHIWIDVYPLSLDSVSTFGGSLGTQPFGYGPLQSFGVYPCQVNVPPGFGSLPMHWFDQVAGPHSALR